MTFTSDSPSRIEPTFVELNRQSEDSQRMSVQVGSQMEQFNNTIKGAAIKCTVDLPYIAFEFQQPLNEKHINQDNDKKDIFWENPPDKNDGYTFSRVVPDENGTIHIFKESTDYRKPFDRKGILDYLREIPDADKFSQNPLYKNDGYTLAAAPPYKNDGYMLADSPPDKNEGYMLADDPMDQYRKETNAHNMKVFAEVDTDHNGKLSLKEIESAKSAAEKFDSKTDLNRDDMIT